MRRIARTDEGKRYCNMMMDLLGYFPLNHSKATILGYTSVVELSISYFTALRQSEPHQTRFDIQIIGNRGYVNDLQIIKSMRRKGYGSMLYDTIEKFFRGAGCEKVRLTAFNEAIKFWESVGFRQGKNILGFEKVI